MSQKSKHSLIKTLKKCWQTKGIITVVSSFNAIDNSKPLKYDIKAMPKIFQKFFSNLAEFLPFI